jgi:hypothetical protein
MLQGPQLPGGESQPGSDLLRLCEHVLPVLQASSVPPNVQEAREWINNWQEKKVRANRGQCRSLPWQTKNQLGLGLWHQCRRDGRRRC